MLTDPDSGLRYSPEPSDYAALCLACHAALDARVRAALAELAADPAAVLPLLRAMRPQMPAGYPRMLRRFVGGDAEHEADGNAPQPLAWWL